MQRCQFLRNYPKMSMEIRGYSYDDPYFISKKGITHFSVNKRLNEKLSNDH